MMAAVTFFKWKAFWWNSVCMGGNVSTGLIQVVLQCATVALGAVTRVAYVTAIKSSINVIHLNWNSRGPSQVLEVFF